MISSLPPKHVLEEMNAGPFPDLDEEELSIRQEGSDENWRAAVEAGLIGGGDSPPSSRLFRVVVRKLLRERCSEKRREAEALMIQWIKSGGLSDIRQLHEDILDSVRQLSRDAEVVLGVLESESSSRPRPSA